MVGVACITWHLVTLVMTFLTLASVLPTIMTGYLICCCHSIHPPGIYWAWERMCDPVALWDRCISVAANQTKRNQTDLVSALFAFHDTTQHSWDGFLEMVGWQCQRRGEGRGRGEVYFYYPSNLYAKRTIPMNNVCAVMWFKYLFWRSAEIE